MREVPSGVQTPTRSRGSSDMVKVAKRISNPSVRGSRCYSGIHSAVRARNQHARRSTPWRVVFCEKMQKSGAEWRSDPVPPGLKPLKNGIVAIGLV
jgi:hypothetical protein